MNAHNLTTAAAAMLALCTATAQAQITYLDADTSNQPGSTNTTNADGTPFTPPLTTAGAPPDNQWWERTGFANGGDILAVNGASDAPVIRTTISGLVPGAGYDVYVYYWWADPFGNGEWDLGAGFTQAGITHFLYTDGSPITSLFANEPILIQEGNRDMYQYFVGCTSASASGTIDVYIDDNPGNDDRSWYDGVGTAPTTCSNSIGTSYCGPAVANSTGGSALMSASGTAVVANNNLVLSASVLPSNSFGFFMTSRTQGFVQSPGGSQGDLCLGGSIGRYVGAGQVLNSGVAGAFSLPVDLTLHPTPTGLVSVAPGETWSFQAWFRDSIGGTATSNFTDGREITFF
ncbi:MAG: hypothetical protein R3F49_10065 [Planctomycetota bacterium]